MSFFGKMLGSLRARIRSVRRSVRRRNDSRLHPGRYEALCARLQGRPSPRSILVLCHANICRSPYLEAVLQQTLPHVEVRSAGFAGGGRPAPEHSLTLARRRGIDLAGHRSRVLTRDMLAAANLIIVMDGRQAEALEHGFGVRADRIAIAGDLDPLGGSTRAIRDPFRQSLAVFEKSFSRLDRCAVSLGMILQNAK